MSDIAGIFDPPICRGMTHIDRRRFQKTIKLAAAKVEPRRIKPFQQHCAKDILVQAKLRSVYDRDGQKLVAMRPDIKTNDTSMLQPESRAYIEGEKIELVDLDLALTYEYWTVDELLAAILPVDLIDDGPSGFSMVGHIAHVNLRQPYLPYKYAIGELIKDKNASIKTVVNKMDTIDSVYRNFQMEIIAGDRNLVTEHLESGCRFRFDFSQVYWNSRLHTEHDRLVALFKEGQAVCDVMAGVGPFAIPAAKRNVIVFANDLNPVSHESLLDNIALNNVSDFVVASNLDGRECIRQSLQQLQELRAKQKVIIVKSKAPSRKRAKLDGAKRSPERREIEIPSTFQHYVMNLPATAIEFLDAFRGLFYGKSNTLPLPTIHVHCFTKHEGDDAYKDMTDRISAAIESDILREDIQFHLVRQVAPSKLMFCCSFRLPAAVAYADPF